MSEPVNQHVVPQCYLKQWVDPNTPAGHTPYVWQFEKHTRKGRNKAPHNILKVRDIYTLKFSNGTKDYRIESQVLSRIESEYASVFDNKISKRLPLDEQEHVVLCAFTALMLQRTLGQKENIEGFYDQLIARAEALEKQHGAKPVESLRLKAEKTNAHKKTMVQMLPKLASMLSSMTVAFLCTERVSARFITSDEPCQLFNPKLQWQKFYGPGLGQKDIEVTMPLSPTTKVLFSWSAYRGYCHVENHWAEETNRMTRGHARDSFISCNPKTKRGWYQKYPMSLRFIVKAIWKQARSWLERLNSKHRHHGIFR